MKTRVHLKPLCAEGSVARVAEPATSTAPIVSHLIANGGVYMGKLRTVEFASGGWGTNKHVGAPVNPWSREKALVCGGSSSGSGAAVASGIVPCAIGTDTGGSVRLPAAFCGVVGLKVTKGLLSTDGIHPLSHTLDTPGPLARSVEDCALMCAAMMAPDACAAFVRESESAMAAGVQGLRLAVMGDIARAAVTDPVQLAAFDAAIETLRSLGADVSVFDWDADSTSKTRHVISVSEGYFHNREVVDDPTSKMDPVVHSRLLQGKNFSAHEYIAAMEERASTLASWLEGLGDRVAWLSPTNAMRPIPLDDESLTKPWMKSLGPFTHIANHLGLCAITLPTGPIEATDEGLPTSLQITCRGGDEMMALRIAHAYERARGPLADPPHYAL